MSGERGGPEPANNLHTPNAVGEGDLDSWLRAAFEAKNKARQGDVQGEAPQESVDEIADDIENQLKAIQESAQNGDITQEKAKDDASATGVMVEALGGDNPSKDIELVSDRSTSELDGKESDNHPVPMEDEPVSGEPITGESEEDTVLEGNLVGEGNDIEPEGGQRVDIVDAEVVDETTLELEGNTSSANVSQNTQPAPTSPNTQPDSKTEQMSEEDLVKLAKELAPEKLELFVGTVTEKTEESRRRGVADRRFEADNTIVVDKKGIKGFFQRVHKVANGIFVQGLARSIVKTRYSVEEGRKMKETHLLAGHDEASNARLIESTAEIIKNQDMYGNVLNSLSGEHQRALDSEEGGQIKDILNDMTQRLLDGEFNVDDEGNSTASLNRDRYNLEARSRIAALLKDRPDSDSLRQLLGSGEVILTDMLAASELIKARIDHARTVAGIEDEISNDARMQIINDILENTAITGIQRDLSMKTEIADTWTNRIMGKAEKIGINGHMVAALGVVTAYTVLDKFAKTKTAALTRFGLVSAGSALIAYKQGVYDTEYQQAQIRNDLADGLVRDNVNNARGRRIEALVSGNMVRVDDVMRGFDSFRDQNGEMTVDSQDKFNGLLAAAARSSHLRNFETSHKHSLLIGDSTERDNLAIETAKTRHLLRQYYDANPDAKISVDGRELSFDEVYQGAEETLDIATLETYSAQSKEEKTMRQKEGMKRARVALVVGAGIGFAIQEVMAVSDVDTQGVVESLRGMGDDLKERTPLAAIVDVIRGKGGVEVAGGGALEPPTSWDDLVNKLGGGDIRADDRLDLVDNGDSFEIKAPDGTMLTVEKEPDGSLSQMSIDMLQDKFRNPDGTSYFQYDEEVRAITTTEPYSYSAEEWALNEGKPVEWHYMDNDTLAPQFDLNELRGDITTDSEGNWVVSFDRMVQGDSFNNGEVADVNGRLAVLIVPTESTFSQPIVAELVNNGTTSQLVIPQGAELSQIFETTPDGSGNIFGGEMNFKGYQLSWAQMTGEVNPDTGAMHANVLASLPGDNTLEGVTGIREVTNYVTDVEMYIEPQGSSFEAPDVQVPPFVYVPYGEGIGGTKAEQKRAPGPSYPSGSYGERMSDERLRSLSSEFSPVFLDNPRAKVGLFDGLKHHLNFLRTRAGDGYVDEIEDAIEKTPGLKSIDKETKAIITIPVGAALESDNIYRTLSLYGKQEGVDMSAFKVLLHVNWIDSAEKDPVKKAAIAKTQSEIERAKKDFPNLNIDVIQSIWSQEKLDRREYGDRLIGHVSQKMYDTAMLAVERAISEGRMEGDSDVLVIKNDADALGMDRRYVEKMIRSFEGHPDKDVFTGGIYWGAERHADLPGFAFVSKFYETARIVAGLRKVGAYQSSFGVNTAIRMSTFAAVGGIGHYSDQDSSAPDDLAIGERVYAARNLGRLNGGKSNSSYPSNVGSSNEDGENEYHQHVVGASIDSDASRMETPYVEGRTVVGTWAAATDKSGSMVDRNAGYSGSHKENLYTRSGADQVIGRIEENISAVLSHWITDDNQRNVALALMMPSEKELGGKRAYSLVHEDDGRVTFRLTKEGKSRMIRNLRKDGRGNKDPYGERTTRRLYGQDRRPRGKRGIYSRKPHIGPMILG